MGLFRNDYGLIDLEKNVLWLKYCWYLSITSTNLIYRKIYVKTILVRKSEGKRSPERPSHKWNDHIKLYLKQIGYENVNWIQLPQDRDQWQAVL
jgi:hypothetical protein